MTAETTTFTDVLRTVGTIVFVDALSACGRGIES